MAQVKRFFHVRDKTQPRGGATVLVTGEDNGLAVRVQVAYCSPKDQFCRATGRAAAREAMVIAIPLKGLPGLLKKVSKRVLRRMSFHGFISTCGEHDQHTVVQVAPKNWRQKHELAQRDWSFSTKYWSPRIEKADNPEAGQNLGDLLAQKLGVPHRGVEFQ